MIEELGKRKTKSLSYLLIDITTLEVNTMVVEQVTGNQFIPWEVYRDVYPISKQYLESRGVYPALRDRYLSLRKQLEIEYCLLLVEHDPTAIKDCPILTDRTVNLDLVETKLPNPFNTGDRPTENSKIQSIFKQQNFLNSLEKIGQLKLTLDLQNQALKKNQTLAVNDIIYAQTVIKLNGEIINRFHHQLFEHEHKDLILKIHQEEIVAGSAQWHKLLETALSSTFAQPTLSTGDFP